MNSELIWIQSNKPTNETGMKFYELISISEFQSNFGKLNLMEWNEIDNIITVIKGIKQWKYFNNDEVVNWFDEL